MIASPNLDQTSKLALDTNSLNGLKNSAKAGTPAAMKEAATQFEAMFINMMMKSMRDATPQETVYAPEFRREIEEPVAGAIAVLPQTRLVITEGNYLLHDLGGWAGVAPLLDDVWYVDVDDALRTDRLTRRHELFGRSRQDAVDWVSGTDEPNARLVAATRSRARLVFDWRG